MIFFVSSLNTLIVSFIVITSILLSNYYLYQLFWHRRVIFSRFLSFIFLLSLTFIKSRNNRFCMRMLFCFSFCLFTAARGSPRRAWVIFRSHDSLVIDCPWWPGIRQNNNFVFHFFTVVLRNYKNGTVRALRCVIMRHIHCQCGAMS